MQRFTFCVPARWRPFGAPAGGDARTWRGGSGSITWGTGEYPPRRIASAQVIVRAGDPGYAFLYVRQLQRMYGQDYLCVVQSYQERASAGCRVLSHWVH